MITIENRVGRLIEARFVAPVPETEFEAFEQERERLMQRLGRDRVVCMDLSRLRLLAPAQADTFVQFLRGSRPGLTRTACLLPAGEEVLALQFARIIREARNPARRAFRNRDELTGWLGAVLRADERARLTAFLDEA